LVVRVIISIIGISGFQVDPIEDDPGHGGVNFFKEFNGRPENRPGRGVTANDQEDAVYLRHQLDRFGHRQDG
jgi:hypothetical protein